MLAYVNDQQLTMSTLFYAPSGGLQGTEIDFGIAIDGLSVPISSALLLGSSTVRMNPAAGGGTIFVMETVLGESWVHTFGSSAFYVVFEEEGREPSVDVLQLLSLPGTGPDNGSMPVVVRPESPPPGIGPPRTAVAGLPSCFKPKMKSAAATMYQTLISSMPIICPQPCRLSS